TGGRVRVNPSRVWTWERPLQARTGWVRRVGVGVDQLGEPDDRGYGYLENGFQEAADHVPERPADTPESGPDIVREEDERPHADDEKGSELEGDRQEDGLTGVRLACALEAGHTKRGQAGHDVGDAEEGQQLGDEVLVH